MAVRFTQFESSSYSAPEVPAAWASFISDEITAIDKLSSTSFRANAQHISGPYLNISRVRTSRSLISAPGRPSARRPEESLVVHLNMGSASTFEQFGVAAQLLRNDVFVCQSDHPYTIQTDDSFEIIAFTLAPHMLHDCGIDLRQKPVSRIRGASGPGAALSLLVRDLWSMPGKALDVSTWQETQRMFASVLSMAIAWEANSIFDARSVPDDIRQFIATRLGDPELDTALIAHAFGQSPRQLQRLFAADGTTPRQYILDCRLDEAARRLKTSSQTVTDIAFATGFDDLTHFGRAFRRRFDLSPRSYRARCLEGIAVDRH